MPSSSDIGPKVIGFGGCLLALLCSPLLVPWLFAIEPLNQTDTTALWIFAATLFACSLLIAKVRFRARKPIAALMMPVFLLIGTELGARVLANTSGVFDVHELRRLGARTYPDLSPWQAHPFLQFLGRPKFSLAGNAALSSPFPFNRQGFLGPDYEHEKPADTLRIACLGGSTTARGYPTHLQTYLEEVVPDRRIEAMNFGIGFYTSAHSTVNLVLNAVHYSPDYAVFHHAWNDVHVRNVRGTPRTDYSHVFKPFEPLSIPDVHLIRASILYRLVKHRLFGEPDWAFIGSAARRWLPPKHKPPQLEIAELIPYYNNLVTFLDVCEGRGIRPILTTQPRTTALKPGLDLTAAHIDQCNDVVRELAKREGDRALFVDLDRELTGRDDLFIDLGHMSPEGMQAKAAAIGAAIREDWDSRPR